MTRKFTDNLSKPMLTAVVGVCFLAFTIEATPSLLDAVPLPLLSLVAQLLLLFFLLSVVVVGVSEIRWLCAKADDDRDKLRYWQERRELDIEERRRQTMPLRASRSTDSGIPIPPRRQGYSRRPNTSRFDV